MCHKRVTYQRSATATVESFATSHCLMCWNVSPSNVGLSSAVSACQVQKYPKCCWKNSLKVHMFFLNPQKCSKLCPDLMKVTVIIFTS